MDIFYKKAYGSGSGGSSDDDVIEQKTIQRSRGPRYQNVRIGYNNDFQKKKLEKKLMQINKNAIFKNSSNFYVNETNETFL